MPLSPDVSFLLVPWHSASWCSLQEIVGVRVGVETWLLPHKLRESVSICNFPVSVPFDPKHRWRCCDSHYDYHCHCHCYSCDYYGSWPPLSIYLAPPSAWQQYAMVALQDRWLPVLLRRAKVPPPLLVVPVYFHETAPNARECTATSSAPLQPRPHRAVRSLGDSPALLARRQCTATWPHRPATARTSDIARSEPMVSTRTDRPRAPMPRADWPSTLPKTVACSHRAPMPTFPPLPQLLPRFLPPGTTPDARHDAAAHGHPRRAGDT
mmetsp:Transcript_7469/g.16199  ORF Transcript_7469/g.16199 Transcript_7469/m.16199 type:complete len:267 (-) Transcript_7469:633-1433(-)